MHELGFTEDEHEFCVNDLSGGQQNRLMIARAIINAPNLILLNEPTNHLELATLVQFENILNSLDIKTLFQKIANQKKLQAELNTLNSQL